jgi:hypothetical protein
MPLGVHELTAMWLTNPEPRNYINAAPSVFGRRVPISVIARFIIGYTPQISDGLCARAHQVVHLNRLTFLWASLPVGR